MIDLDDDRTKNEKDLTMLVKRLVRKLSKVSPQDPIIQQTLEWLDRKRFTRHTDLLR